jgi:DNA polymerase III subunit beta
MQKFTIGSDTLLKELKKLRSLVPSNPVIPIIENFLFEIKDGLLKITASDLQTAASIEIAIESEDLSIAIPARMLLDTLNSLPTQPITFTIDTDNQLEILSDNGRYQIACEDAADYPQPAQPKETTSFLLSSDTLSTALSYTLPFVSNDEMKPAMNGINLSNKDGKTIFAATDSHRLSVLTIDSNIDSNLSIIVSGKALGSLKSLLPTQICEIDVSFNDSNIFFNFGNTKVVSRLIDERYPDYQNVIPTSNDKILKIDKSQLQSSLKRISIYANKTSQQIRFKLENNNLLIAAEDVDFSNEAKENLPCEFEGESIEIGFNGKYLAEMLSNLVCDNVTMEFSEPNRAVLIYPTDKVEDVLMLVMPVMLNNYY